MAALSRIPAFMTVEEFLNWDAPGPTLWQLMDGVLVAMAPNTGPHSVIQGELARRIGNHLIEGDSRRRELIRTFPRRRAAPDPGNRDTARTSRSSPTN
jgi:Uma2 family endonuclease